MQGAFLCKEGANSAQKRETAVQFTTQTINMLLPREMVVKCHAENFSLEDLVHNGVIDCYIK